MKQKLYLIPRFILRLFDIFLYLIILILLYGISLLKKLFIRKQNILNKNVLVHIVRYHDTIEGHETVNSSAYLEDFYDRPVFDYALMLCVGDGIQRIKRLGKKVIGVNVYVSDFNPFKKVLPYTSVILRDIMATFKTIAIIKKKKYGILELTAPSNLIVRAILVKNFTNIKLLVRVVGNADLIYFFNKFPLFFPFQIKLACFKIFEYFYDKIIYSLFFSKCDLVIGLNRNNFENAISNGADIKKSYLVRIKIDQAMLYYPEIKRGELEGFPKTGKVVTIWSRLSKEMLIDLAISGFGHLVNSHNMQNLHLTIIGKGPEKENLSKLANDLGLNNRVHFLGFQNRQYIKSAALNSSVILSPLGGSALVEAALLAKPIVAFDMEWQSELIIDGYSGLLCDPQDPENIAKKILYLLENTEKANALGIEAKKFAEQMFDLKTIIENENRIYSKISLKDR